MSGQTEIKLQWHGSFGESVHGHHSMLDAVLPEAAHAIAHCFAAHAVRISVGFSTRVPHRSHHLPQRPSRRLASSVASAAGERGRYQKGRP